MARESSVPVASPLLQLMGWRRNTRRRGCQISRNAGQAKIAFGLHCAKLRRLPAALPLGLFRSEVRQIRWRGRIRRTRSRVVR